MSLEDKNIEELFRTELEDIELPVDNSMWNNISQGLATSNTVASSASSIFITKVLAFLGLGGAAVAIGIAVGLYITPADENILEKENTVQIVPVIDKESEIITDAVSSEVTEDQNIVQEIVKPRIIENDPAISKEEQIKQSRQIIVKSTKEDDPVKNDGRNNSWVNNFLTPVKPNSKGITNVVEEVPNIIEEKSIIMEVGGVPDDIIEVVEKDVIIAEIVASPVGGYAPLEVSFAQQSDKGFVTWDFGDGNTSSASNPTHIFEKYGSYQVKLTIEDKEGAIFEDYRLIKVEPNSALVNIPNIITPNGDGKNDFFTIQGKHLETFQLVILTQKGELVFESTNITNSWDGTNYFGEKVDSGTFVVLISAVGVDGKKYEHKGIVMVNY